MPSVFKRKRQRHSDGNYGLYRDSDGWVMVQYDRHASLIERDRYVANGYAPPYDKLPTLDQYNDAATKRSFDEIMKEAGKTPQERSS
jgi:hypothetical protein